MATSTAIAVYFLVWWLTLFAVLPWGVSAQGETGAPGTDPGAPLLPRLLMKLLWTTLVASALFGTGAFLYTRRIVTLDDLARWMGV